MNKKNDDTAFLKQAISSYQRKRNLYNPDSKKPYRLSRSRLETFINCPRCFYLDRKLGVEPPGIPPYTLNSAVDVLLKKEFDLYRQKKEAHPLMKSFGIDAVPWDHPQMDDWRNNFKGVQYHDKTTNLFIFGAVDDLWINSKGEIHVVDYKATSTQGEVTIDTPSRQAFKRQMEIYQWLLAQNDVNVSSLGFFVYCNADKNRPIFDSKLEFSLDIIPYEGQRDWVPRAIKAAHECLELKDLPGYTKGCSFCQYNVVTQFAQANNKRKNDQIELFSK